MSHYKQQEFDFIERTQKILIQYDALKLETLDLPDAQKKEKYETTFLMNCFVGLLIVPQQNWFEQLPETTISKKEWGIDVHHISVIRVRGTGSSKGILVDEPKTVKNVCRHLRKFRFSWRLCCI